RGTTWLGQTSASPGPGPPRSSQVRTPSCAECSPVPSPPVTTVRERTSLRGAQAERPRSWPRHLAALGAFGAVFSLLLLPKLLPWDQGRFLANGPADGSIFLWPLGWWAHAAPTL